jgi:hypothetical protein
MNASAAAALEASARAAPCALLDRSLLPARSRPSAGRTGGRARLSRARARRSRRPVCRGRVRAACVSTASSLLGAELSAGPVGKAQAARRIDPRRRCSRSRATARATRRCAGSDRAPPRPALPWTRRADGRMGSISSRSTRRRSERLARRGVGRLALGVAAPGRDARPCAMRSRRSRASRPVAGVVATGRVARLEAAPGDEERARVLAALRANTLVERVAVQDRARCSRPPRAGTRPGMPPAPSRGGARRQRRAGRGRAGRARARRAALSQCARPRGETPYSHLYARCHEGLARRTGR